MELASKKTLFLFNKKKIVTQKHILEKLKIAFNCNLWALKYQDRTLTFHNFL